MSIGLCDLDMAEYTFVPFNLELMKYATYYKNKGELVILTPLFMPWRHQKFIMRKDVSDGKFPSLLGHKNIDFGGYAYTNGVYLPLPMEIEKLVPDKEVYQRYKKSFREKSKKKAKEFQQMATGEHCRLSLDGETIWEDYECQIVPNKNKLLLIHDYDLNQIEDAYIEIPRFCEKHKMFVGTKFPLEITTSKQLLQIREIFPRRTFFSLKFCGVMDCVTFIEFYMNESPMNHNILYYDITAAPWFKQNGFSEKDFLRIYFQLIFLRKYGFKFLLNYTKTSFQDKNLERVFWLFQRFFNSLNFWSVDDREEKLKEDTLFAFCKNIRESQYEFRKDGSIISVTRADAREIFDYVRQKCYPLFKEFYECNGSNVEEKMYELDGN